MSLGGALQIGRSGLLANQAAIEVAGNNLANVATQSYHRQTIVLQPAGTQQVQSGVFMGRGAQVQQILRQVDDALEGRLRNSVADESGTLARKDVLTQIESVQNELSDSDLSTQLGQFFNAFSNLANQPLDTSLRGLVVQEGQTLASSLRTLHAGLSDLRTQVDQGIDQDTKAADDLLTQVAALNQRIAQSDGGSGGANDLRDQRDSLLGQLAQYLDISTVEQPSGSVDVYVGSLPVILNGQSRGLDVRRQTVNGQTQIDVVLKADGSVLQPTAGKLGATLNARHGDVDQALATLDSFANQLIYQVNRVHSQGQGMDPVSAVTGTTVVADPTAVLNSAAAGLPFVPKHGSFEITVTQKSTGQQVTRVVNVDLDGLGGNDSTLNSLAASLNGVPNVTATVTPDGRLQMAAAGSDFALSFGNDSSGILAALGVNTFFTGKDAGDIDVNATVAGNPNLVAAAQGNVAGDNRNALAIAALRDQALPDLGGASLLQVWNQHVSDCATALGQVNQQAQSATVVRQSLQTQQQQVSGVNSDEEAINLLAYQRAYQGSARLLSVVDQMMQTLLAIQ